MNITPGDSIEYRMTKKVTLRVADISSIGGDAWQVTGQRITNEGAIDVRDVLVPFSTSLHPVTVTKVTPGDLAYVDDETGCHVTWNNNEEAYYVWLGDGAVGAYDSFPAVQMTLEALAE